MATQSTTSKIKSLLSGIGNAVKAGKQNVTNFLNKPIEVRNPVAQKAVKILTKTAQATPVNIVRQGVQQQSQVFNTPIKVSAPVARLSSRLATATPIKIAQPAIVPIKKAFNSWKAKPSNQIAKSAIVPIKKAINTWKEKPSNTIAGPTIRGVADIVNRKIIQPPIKFSQKFGEAMAQPQINKMTQQSNESILNQSRLYLKKGSDLNAKGDKKGAQVYFDASKKLTDMAAGQNNQRIADLEQSKKKLVDSGVATMNVAGMAYNPLGAGITMGAGGLLNPVIERAMGINEPGGFLRGVEGASKYAGFTNISNPIIAGIVGKFAPMINNPLAQNLASRTGNAIGNLIEDRSLSAIYGDKPTLTNDLVSLSLGFILGGKGSVEDYEALQKQLSTYGLNLADQKAIVATLTDLMSNKEGYARLDLGLGKDVPPVKTEVQAPAEVVSTTKLGSQANELDLAITNTGNALGQVRADLAVETDPSLRDALTLRKAQLESYYAELKHLQSGEGYVPVEATQVAVNPKQVTEPITETLQTGKKPSQYGATPAREKKIAAAEKKLTKIKSKVNAQETKISSDTNQERMDWVNNRRASDVEGLIKSKEFEQFDDEGINAIFRFQAGDKTGLEGLQRYFDEKFALLREAGVKLGFKNDYLPQMWKSTREEVEAVFGKRLSKQPSFTQKSLFENYQEGIEAGLVPKFTKISELVRWYESASNRTLADVNFFKKQIDDKVIMPSSRAPSGWVPIPGFPKIKIKDANGKVSYEGGYSAPSEIALLINNYLDAPSEQLLVKIAHYSNRMKGRVLSFGIPNPVTGLIKMVKQLPSTIKIGKEKGLRAGLHANTTAFTEGAGTGLNYFGYSMTKRGFGLGLKTGLTDLRKQFNPEYGRKVLAKLLPTAPDFVKHGGTLSTEGMPGIDEVPSFKNAFSEGWNNLFERTLFEVNIPSSKLTGYDMVWRRNVKNGMPEEEAKLVAAHAMNTIYAGKNLDELGRSKNMQNIFRIIALAPDWLESNIGMAANTLKSFYNFKDPAGDVYRRLVANWIGGYVVMNLVQKSVTGQFMIENDPGHELDFEIGFTPEGQKRYWKMSAGADDWVKIPLDAIRGMINGDFSVLGQALKNRAGVLVQPAVNLSFDKNWAGQPIGVRGKDQYGRQMTPGARIMGIGAELMTPLGVPSAAQGIMNYALGKQGLEQTVTQGLELPIRYAGGPKSKTQKEIADLVKLRGGTGKDIYDISKATAGETMSENQMGLISQSSNPIEAVQNILKIRADKASIKEKNKQAGTDGTSVTDGGEQWYVQKGDEVTAIPKVWNPTPPEYTGNETIDKKLKSQYKSSITARINDVITLFQNGKITMEEAAAEVDKLQGVYEGVSGGAKAKKVTIPKLPIRKTPLLEAPKKFTPVKLKSLLSGIKAPKVAAPAGIKSRTSSYTPIKIKNPKNARRMATTLSGIGRA